MQDTGYRAVGGMEDKKSPEMKIGDQESASDPVVEATGKLDSRFRSLEKRPWLLSLD